MRWLVLIIFAVSGCGKQEPQEPLRIELNSREVEEVFRRAPLPDYNDNKLGSDIDAVRPEPFRPPQFRDDICHHFPPLDVYNNLDIDC
jgi:hypothetical protein